MKKFVPFLSSFVLSNLLVAVVVHYCDIQFHELNIYWAVFGLVGYLLVLALGWLILKALASVKRWLDRKVLKYIDSKKDKIREILGM